MIRLQVGSTVNTEDGMGTVLDTDFRGEQFAGDEGPNILVSLYNGREQLFYSDEVEVV